VLVGVGRELVVWSYLVAVLVDDVADLEHVTISMSRRMRTDN
jgi:hypothetical protein